MYFYNKNTNITYSRIKTGIRGAVLRHYLKLDVIGSLVTLGLVENGLYLKLFVIVLVVVKDLLGIIRSRDDWVIICFYCYLMV